MPYQQWDRVRAVDTIPAGHGCHSGAVTAGDHGVVLGASYGFEGEELYTVCFLDGTIRNELTRGALKRTRLAPTSAFSLGFAYGTVVGVILGIIGGVELAHLL